jgi:prepilin-type processing-associated H-X9-DG protein
MFRHVFDCGGEAEHNRIAAAPKPTPWSGTPEAALGQPATMVQIFEVGAFHHEKLPLYGGVHPTATPVRPPDGRTFNVAYADGHVKVFRLGYPEPAWNMNHDMNWLFNGGAGGDLANSFDK